MNAPQGSLAWVAEELPVPARHARKGELHGNAVAALREMIVCGELAPEHRERQGEQRHGDHGPDPATPCPRRLRAGRPHAEPSLGYARDRLLRDDSAKQQPVATHVKGF